jgi:ethanolamine utilization protein EutN
MIIGRVIGTVVETLKHKSLSSKKILVVKQADETGKYFGQPFLAVDLVGAGENELVCVTQGSSARQAIENTESAADAAIVGIIDRLDILK